jgi:uncharacterized protein
LTVDHDGRREVDADLQSAAGPDALERFFEAFMGGGQGRPRLVSGPGHMFTDNPTKYVSLINLATVADLEREIGRPVDALRFRANLYVEGLPAWEEFDWLNREVGAGDARFRTAERIDRCAATNVDPASGARDLDIPLTLRRSYGHIDCGVLLRVARGGELEVGQTIAPLCAPMPAKDWPGRRSPQESTQISRLPGCGFGSKSVKSMIGGAAPPGISPLRLALSASAESRSAAKK